MLPSAFSFLGNSVAADGVAALSAVVLLIVGWAVKRYLVPFLDTELKRRMAQYVLLIADEVTDQLAAKYPQNELLNWLDQAVDQIIEITGISREVAVRAAEAALARKGIKAV